MGIFDFFSASPKTIYLSGQNPNSEELENYKEIFRILKVQYSLLEDFNSGYKELMIGNRKKARTIARKNFEMFRESLVERIIVSDSSLFYMLKKWYPKLVLNFDIEVIHVSLVILEALKKRGIRFDGEERESFCYHDPCYLGRYFGIFDGPRKVIELLGGNIIEMKKSRESSSCCGAGGCVGENFPGLELSMAKKRVTEVPDESLKIITPCSMCANSLKRAKEDSFEWSGFILGRLRRLLR
jgi:Fe-S oxidoreductase